METQKCKAEGCRVQVMILRHLVTERPAPIEAVPAERGNIVIDAERGSYVVLTKPELEEARREGAPLYLNHWANSKCPIVQERQRAQQLTRDARRSRMRGDD